MSVLFNKERFPLLGAPVETAGDKAWRKMKAKQEEREQLEAHCASEYRLWRIHRANTAKETEALSMLRDEQARYKEAGKYMTVDQEIAFLVSIGMTQDEADYYVIPF